MRSALAANSPRRNHFGDTVKAGQVTTIGSDHSPAPPDMKLDANFFKVWGGISGVQHTLPLLITEGHVKREVALAASQPVCFRTMWRKRFKLPPEKAGSTLELMQTLRWSI